MSENKTSPKPFRRASVIAVSVLLLGLVASIAGNIQSILLEAPAHLGGSMISAVWWPGILFLMIEVAIHTPWAKTGRDQVAQWAGAGIIGSLAFYISYFHLAHVLSSFGYDVVSRYLGPLAVDTAMMVATVALNRIGQARRELATAEELAKADLAKAAELATLATEMAKEMVATPEPELATAEPVATVAKTELVELAEDWATLESDLDAELADMAAGRTPEPAAEPAQDAPTATTAQALTKVPALAAKRIQEALDAGATKAELAALDATLADEGLAGSARTARRWRTAVTNGAALLA